MTAPFRVREILIRRDLAAIADLIELNFSRWLDPDGKRFVTQLRASAGKYEKQFFWQVAAPLDFSLNGFVCQDENGRIIGTAHLFPQRVMGRFGYLIANVCVLPEYRRHGAAEALMQALLRYAKTHYAERVYLQVRDETMDARALYLKLGFQVDAVRTNWILPRLMRPLPISRGIRLDTPLRSERTQFLSCFSQAYPENLLWNLHFDSSLFTMGWIGRCMQWLLGNRSEFLRMNAADGMLIGWGIWQQRESFTDGLWLIPSPNTSADLLSEGLRCLGNRFAHRKAITVNVAATTDPSIFLNAGFHQQDCLLWMSKAVD